MRTLRIVRKKSFVGRLIPYFIIVGINKDCIDAGDMAYPIQNGEVIELEVGDKVFCVAAVADTTTGWVTSKPLFFPGGMDDIELELVTKYSWTKGSSYELRVLRRVKKWRF